ncbi:MAG: IPT/TIG domain-containing protein [Bacteroidetes bacterium]|nr:IPT/TIG domain-containing protein [Bacteroidota bacterium]
MKINNRPVILFCLILLKVLFSFKEIYAQAPQITSFAPDSGSVGSLVTITGTDLGNTSAFSIGGVSALVISNSRNYIGRNGYARRCHRIDICHYCRRKRYRQHEFHLWIYTRIGGFWNQQGSKLVGTGNIGAARQGISVSISADGNTAVAGGFGDNSNQGAAWIWTRTGTLWTQQGVKLVGSGNTGAAQQGTSVSISADGNTVIVGGFADNGNVGAAWVWKRNGGNWTQEGGKLVGGGYVGSSNQGRSVCLSDDGNTAIVGGPNDNFPNGAAWIWIRTGGTWLQQGNKLVGTGGVGIQVQGRSVSISADGNVVIVGGPGDNLNIGRLGYGCVQEVFGYNLVIN